MRAFEIYANDRKVCLAGVGGSGVLSAIVNWVVDKGRGQSFLSVSGLVNPSGESLTWTKEDVSVGDVITIKIVEASSADAPNKRSMSNPGEDLAYRESYVRAMAKKLGWKIQVKTKRSKAKTK